MDAPQHTAIILKLYMIAIGIAIDIRKMNELVTVRTSGTLLQMAAIDSRNESADRFDRNFHELGSAGNFAQLLPAGGTGMLAQSYYDSCRALPAQSSIWSIFRTTKLPVQSFGIRAVTVHDCPPAAFLQEVATKSRSIEVTCVRREIESSNSAGGIALDKEDLLNIYDVPE